MKLLFNHKGHKILISRDLSSAQMDIDNEVSDVKSGFINTHVRDFDLNGKVQNPDGTEDRIRVHYNIGPVWDTISLYFNDALIESKKGAL